MANEIEKPICIMMRNRFGKTNIPCTGEDRDCYNCERPEKMGASRNKKGGWSFPVEDPVFKVTRDIQLPNYLYVKVAGKGNVVIKCEDEGIVVDVYGENWEDSEAIASTWAHDNELKGDDEDSEQLGQEKG